jgi:hypothetical protein
MSGQNWVVAGVIMFGLAGSVVAYLGFQAPARADNRARPGSSSTGPETSGKDVERLRGEVALMQRQMLALRAASAEQKAPEAAPAAEPETLDPEMLREQREESTRRWKEHMVEVARAFEQEGIDRDFARTTRDAVDRVVQNDAVIQKVAGKVECRSRTCRVEIRDSKSTEVSQQLPRFLQAVGGTLRRAQADYVVGENGQKTLLLYLTNEEPVAETPHR